MLGYLRFFLAFMVLISHVDVRIQGLNPGVVAVVIFYILAGHVVSRLWWDILPPGPGRLGRFYRDRLLRIMPLYLYVALLTLVFLFFTGYGTPGFSVSALAGNFLVVPLNYYMFLDTTILKDPAWCLIPPAWSLGAELQAYLVLPLVLVVKPLKYFVSLLSLGVYCLANLSVLHPDYFGYRLIFGVFFVFVAGSCIHKCHQGKKAPFKTWLTGGFDAWFPWILWAGTAVVWGIFTTQNLFNQFAYTRETFLGLLCGIPLVFFLGKSRIKLPGNALMGSLSYGVFLSHFLIIWCLDDSGVMSPGNPLYISVVVVGSTLVGLAGVKLLETPVDEIRKKGCIPPKD